MDLFFSLKKLINRINDIDTKSKRMSKESSYSTNPFSFKKDKTYVWVEKVKDFNKCSWLGAKFFKNDK